MLAKPQLAVIGRVSTLVQDLGNIMVAVGTAGITGTVGGATPGMIEDAGHGDNGDGDNTYDNGGTK